MELTAVFKFIVILLFNTYIRTILRIFYKKEGPKKQKNS